MQHATNFFLAVLVFGATTSLASSLSPHVVWRVRKADTLQLQWRVYELELLSDDNCGGVPLVPYSGTGVVASSNAAEGENAFDGSLSSFWTSAACTSRISCYVGRLYPVSTQVRCVRLFQDSDRSYSAYTVSLEYASVVTATTYTNSATYSFLTGGMWLDLGKNWSGPDLRTRWRIANTAVIKSGWRVMEFRLFADSSCEEMLPHEVPISSDYSGNSSPQLALDGDLTTSWMSPCAIGGCASYSAWIGVHMTRDVTEVSCMKLYQSTSSSEITTNLAVQFWDGVSWVAFKSFATLVGGMELFLSEMFYKNAWRVTNAQSTTNQLQINEVRFFYDAQCSKKPVIPGIGLTTAPNIKGLSSPKASDSSDISVMFDDDLNSRGWKSECVACNANEVYVGIEITDRTDSDADIACVNIFMEPGASVRQLQVQYIGTIKWEVLYNVVYTSGGYWLSLTSLANAPVLPSRMYPLYNNPMYRVRVAGSWSGVVSVAFFPNADCRGDPIEGTPVASLGKTGTEPVFPFPDGPQGAGDWEAATLDGWLGVVAKDKTVSVGCAQVTERKRRAGESKLIVLEELKQWQPAESFTVVQSFMYDDSRTGGSSGGKTTLQIGYEDATLWRARRADSFAGIPSGANWRVAELLWFATPDCSGDSSEGVYLGSSALTLGVTDLAQAADGDEDTYWQPASSDFRAWLGVSFGEKPVHVACIKLLQPIDTTYAARTVNLDTSDPLTRTWTTVRQINFLSGGLWLSLTPQFTAPAPQALWRVVIVAPMGKRLFWQVRKLRFFRDSACTGEIQGPSEGVPVASGYSGNSAPVRSALDEETQFWAAQCDYCSSYQAWIGFLMPHDPLPEEPLCVEIETNVGLEILKWEVEKFTGQSDSSCTEDPSQKTCWTALVQTTRKSCVYSTQDFSQSVECSELVYVSTTPRPETVYIESENVVLIVAAYVAPAAIVLALIVCCCALLSSPKEDKRPLNQLFVYPTYLWFVFWIGVIVILVLLSFWLLSMLLFSALLALTLLGCLALPALLFERGQARKYAYTAGALVRGSGAFLMTAFATQQAALCIFDACLFRTTATYLGISSAGDFLSFLQPVVRRLENVVAFTSPASFRCGGSSLIFAALITVAGFSVLLVSAAYDVFATSECSNVAALVSRKRSVYAVVSSLNAVFIGALQVVALASAGALFHGFSDSAGISSGCRKEYAADQEPVAVHAPTFLYFFATMSLWVVAILYVSPIVVAFLSGHFFPSGIDPRLADFVGIPELGLSEKKVEEFQPGTEHEGQETGRPAALGRRKSTLGMKEERTPEETEMDAIFHVLTDVYSSIFSSFPILVGRVVLGPFRISERAKLLSVAFQLPSPPLLPVQRATVRIVSLVWQSIPVGIFAGKLAEYLSVPPVRNAVPQFPGFARSVLRVQVAGGAMYLCVVLAGAFLSGITALIFLVFAVALGIFRASQMAVWVKTQPEPSLAPGNSEEMAEAEQAQAAPTGNEVVVIGNRQQPPSVTSRGPRAIRFLDNN